MHERITKSAFPRLHRVLYGNENEPTEEAEAVGAVLMVAAVGVLFRAFLKNGLVQEAKAQADRGLTWAGWRGTPRWTWP